MGLQEFEPQIPAPLDNGERVQVVKLEDIPDPTSLAAWLAGHGLDTQAWGTSSGSKDVKKYWKEIKLGESGLEVWRAGAENAQDLRLVRVVHVLRAKVCSVESYEHEVFLFNTWQQFADGRRRTRNALLSEKLVYSELPLEPNLPGVCERAVQEEMQCVVEAAFSIGPKSQAPQYGPDIAVPPTVDRVRFVNHTIELENSPSFPGLLTMYHLYTVEIVCVGIPKVDFNTLEYEAADASGSRALKYVHAWVWLKWPQIQRYLFEGSELKERKGKTSFEDVRGLTKWLRQFDLDPTSWGKERGKTVDNLFKELQKEEAHLELWGRNDGVQLLMRVAHVIQLRLYLADERMSGKFLLQVWQQGKNGSVRGMNRLLAKKLSSANVPFTQTYFHEAAEEAVKGKLAYIMDVHYQMDPTRPPSQDDCKPCDAIVKRTQFVDHRHDVEESPAYIGMHTMYHLYTFDVECEGLPTADFSSLDFESGNGPWACGWRWVTWQQTMDILHAQVQAHAKLEEIRNVSLKKHGSGIEAICETLRELSRTVDDLSERTGAEDADKSQEVRKAVKQAARLQEDCENAKATFDNIMQASDFASSAEVLPPSMLSKMASDTIATHVLLEGAVLEVAAAIPPAVSPTSVRPPESSSFRNYFSSSARRLSGFNVASIGGVPFGGGSVRSRAVLITLGLLVIQVSVQISLLVARLAGKKDPERDDGLLSAGLVSLVLTTLGVGSALAMAARG